MAQTNSNPYLAEISNELNAAVTELNHPLKFCVLSSIGLDNTPQSRIVILRKVTPDFKFTFFTDERSEKVHQIKANSNVSLLFYHPINKIQIKVNGTASLVEDPDIIQKKWLRQSPVAQKNYTTTKAPGSKLNDAHEIQYLKDENYFCIVTIQAKKVEYLKLKDTSHFKVKFHKDINGWVSEFLVP